MGNWPLITMEPGLLGITSWTQAFCLEYVCVRLWTYTEILKGKYIFAVFA